MNNQFETKRKSILRQVNDIAVMAVVIGIVSYGVASLKTGQFGDFVEEMQKAIVNLQVDNKPVVPELPNELGM